jgi:hypothetical protein
MTLFSGVFVSLAIPSHSLANSENFSDVSIIPPLCWLHNKWPNHEKFRKNFVMAHKEYLSRSGWRRRRSEAINETGSAD